MRNHFSKIYLAMALSGLFLTPAAAGSSFLPPAEIVENVLNDYPGVLAAKEQIDSAHYEAKRLRKGPHELELSGSYISRSVDGFGAYDEYDATLARAVRLPGKARLDRLSGELGVEVAENQAADARHEAAVFLKDAWLAWLSAIERSEIDEAAANNMKTNLDAIERRRALKDASDLEVDLARAALAQAQSEAAASAGEVDRSRAALLAIFPELPLPSHPGKLPVPSAPADPAQLVELIISRSHELAMFEKEARRLDAVAKRARLDRFADPTIGVRGFSERNGEETGVGMVFSIPLGGGARHARAARDKSEANAAHYQAARARRDLRSRAEQKAAAARAAYASWQSAQAALRASEKAVMKTRKAFSLDARNLRELLLAEQHHLDIQRLEASLRLRAHSTRLQLLIDAHELWTVHHTEEGRIAAHAGK